MARNRDGAAVLVTIRCRECEGHGAIYTARGQFGFSSPYDTETACAECAGTGSVRIHHALVQRSDIELEDA